jgi:hypothetical protein
MVRCIECNATRSRVENAEWVVTRGITTREQAQAIARKYGARSYLDVAFTLRPSSVSMEVEMVRAADGSIAYAEAYRMDADKALLYRGADRAQTREERIKDLEDRINQHPRWGQTVEFGAMMIPATSGWAAGGLGRFQIAEEFGEQRQHHAGFSVAGFLNTGSLAGGIVSAIWQMRLGDNNIFVPQWWLGLSAGAFLTGAPGNTPIFGATLRWLPGQRFSLHGALNYMIPFQLHGKGDNFGGLVPEVGVGFVWN